MDPSSLIVSIKPETLFVDGKHLTRDPTRYFNNEEHEATRYNASLTAYEKVPPVNTAHVHNALGIVLL